MKQQKATLAKQREEYVKKSATLQRELEILRQQCDEIGKEGGRENNRIIKENQKLQVSEWVHVARSSKKCVLSEHILIWVRILLQIEIQNKMKSIHNVIDMLTGIIGDNVTIDDLKSKFKLELNKRRSKSPKEDFPKGKSPSPDRSSGSGSDKEAKAEKDIKERKSSEDKPMYNFVHYDPEMHWCRVCDIFPKTAKEYLNHLHSNEHKEVCLVSKYFVAKHVCRSKADEPYYDNFFELFRTISNWTSERNRNLLKDSCVADIYIYISARITCCGLFSCYI